MSFRPTHKKVLKFIEFPFWETKWRKSLHQLLLLVSLGFSFLLKTFPKKIWNRVWGGEENVKIKMFSLLLLFSFFFCQYFPSPFSSFPSSFSWGQEAKNRDSTCNEIIMIMAFWGCRKNIKESKYYKNKKERGQETGQNLILKKDSQCVLRWSSSSSRV